MDTGVGISEEVLPHVFDLFVQGDHAGRAKSGLGIGLALARRLIDMHGGRIEARSAGTGRGSSFVIHLPVSNSSLQAPVVVDRPNGSPPEVRRRVLVVDDNRDAADTLADLVRTLGGEALTANDGESGARRAAEFAPDVVLLDIGMPGMDGYETCRQLRRSCQYDVFIVALTGRRVWSDAHQRTCPRFRIRCASDQTRRPERAGAPARGTNNLTRAEGSVGFSQASLTKQQSSACSLTICSGPGALSRGIPKLSTELPT
jgi:CheY-like chemotaxis protein